ncbi:DDE-type integrase/transposase/recombinase [Variovorax sp. UMC13]|uniref:DDE-type integrase/transposase/recombinase n=1 Tax=Variovorax sp. UMC13 TaxID=1862326 RepID=UPI001601FF33|nr:DDE-type integrase/transposase/recombinase [Variovorax sp. UMC13]MBB1601558.1 integrase [Variovorax sp. UMC13]
MPALSPEIHDYMRGLAQRLDAVGHGGATPLVREAAEFLAWSPQTVYRQLKAAVGWSSGRRARCDKGSTSVSLDALATLGAAQREAVRENGKQTLFTTTARGMLEMNGIEFGVGNSRLNTLLRDRKLNVAAQRVAAPVQELRAPHPNHTHQVDPSLCLVYYLKDRQYIVRDSEFYKNKLDAMAKVKFKVYRYVMYDKASATIVPWYCEAVGEDQHNLFNFLMFAWGVQPGRLFRGVPKFMLWDKGSANQSAAIKNLLKQLEVTPLDHQAGNARAKGGVENANNIVETQFESRLRFEPVDNVDQLNAAASAWANSYCANLIPGQDTRLRRRGMVGATARYDLWQLITEDQLRLLPPVDVCRALMASREVDRLVRPNLTISFRHPAANRPADYSLRGLDGISVGDKVQVRALVYGECAIQVEVPRYDGEMMIHRVEPVQGFDRFGQLEAAAEIGAEYKAMPRTEAQHATATMDAKAYPGMDADEVKAARDKKTAPFEGKLVAHSYLKDIEQPTYLPRAGSEIEAPAHVRIEPTKLDAVDAMLRVAKGIGRYLTADENAFMTARYAEGVPEDQIEALIAQFTAPVQAEPMRAAGGLRAV